MQERTGGDLYGRSVSNALMKTGIDNIENYGKIFEGKRIGLITNPTGVDKSFKPTVDILHEKFNLVKLFAPEHGIRGDIQAGELVNGYKDEKTGLEVVSLYGENRRPSPEKLEDVDMLAMDIQDAGLRFYTYIYTMTYAMEAAAALGKAFVVFDRPCPLGGANVEGNILDTKYKSFIGRYPVPQRYGLTIGEFARFSNTEFGINCELYIIPMSGWKREMYFDDTDIPWILPSPNLPTVDSVIAYAGTCIFEGTNISEGRGTTKPFQFIGAPWLPAEKLADRLNALEIKGVYFRPCYFTPFFSKHSGLLCKGVELHVVDKRVFRPVVTGIAMLYEIIAQSGENFQVLPPYREGGHFMLDYNTGNSYIREKKYSLKQIAGIYEKESAQFKKDKEKYHLYTVN